MGFGALLRLMMGWCIVSRWRSLALALCTLLAAGGNFHLKQSDGSIQQQTHKADVENGQNDFTDVVLLVGVPDEEANADDTGHYNFRCNNGQPSETNGNP